MTKILKPAYGRLLDDFVRGATNVHPWEVTIDQGMIAMFAASFLDATPPFDAPGLYQVGENQYQAVIVAQAFVFTPSEITVPAGAEVTFLVASKDVVHGFMIPRTTVNAMVIPGQVTEVTYSFDETGEHQIICHEFCGIGHHQMYGKVVVEG